MSKAREDSAAVVWKFRAARLVGFTAAIGMLVAGCAAARPAAPTPPPAAPSLPDAKAFAASVRSGEINPETFDFAGAGFWNFAALDRVQWIGGVDQEMGFSRPVTNECATESQRAYATLAWSMLATQATDAADWKTNAQALRARLAQLDQQLAHSAPDKPSTDPLVQELLVRFARDQDVREVFAKSRLTEGLPPLASKLALMIFATRMVVIDCDNTAWLQAQLPTVGWFSIPKYGADADNAAFYLVQHADRDHAFQREMLTKLQALPPGQTDPKRIGYLWDRVALSEGKPQRYGTQGKCAAGVWTPDESEDPANLDKRRAQLGMEPIAEHAKTVARESCPK
jgi:hypothetical protein